MYSVLGFEELLDVCCHSRFSTVWSKWGFFMMDEGMKNHLLTKMFGYNIIAELFLKVITGELVEQ